jgi:hypothetical protein
VSLEYFCFLHTSPFIYLFKRYYLSRHCYLGRLSFLSLTIHQYLLDVELSVQCGVVVWWLVSWCDDWLLVSIVSMFPNSPTTHILYYTIYNMIGVHGAEKWIHIFSRVDFPIYPQKEKSIDFGIHLRGDPFESVQGRGDTWTEKLFVLTTNPRRGPYIWFVNGGCWWDLSLGHHIGEGKSWWTDVLGRLSPGWFFLTGWGGKRKRQGKYYRVVFTGDTRFPRVPFFMLYIIYWTVGII